jgi:hypothetical protein
MIPTKLINPSYIRNTVAMGVQAKIKIVQYGVVIFEYIIGDVSRIVVLRHDNRIKFYERNFLLVDEYDTGYGTIVLLESNGMGNNSTVVKITPNSILSAEEFSQEESKFFNNVGDHTRRFHLKLNSILIDQEITEKRDEPKIWIV